ncbi:Nucleoside diphosphate-linked moiety X motif 19 [Halotydeus destructor]|nr:Nucleoside diphosphate-linked moiety X motif 19 [Halotydeus destructor]
MAAKKPLPPWKEAATLILVAKASMAQKVGGSLAKSLAVSSRVVPDDKQNARHLAAVAKTDYRILMVKRSGLSSYMASAYVFPGGQVELADYSPRWWSLFEKMGVSQSDLEQFSASVNGTRPPMVTDPMTLIKARAAGEIDQNATNLLPADIALRISAIRETFEEAGVLLLTKGKTNGDENSILLSDAEDSKIDFVYWQDRVRNDANSFIDLCYETNLCPDLWSLSEWSNWLTPISVGHKRFDTMFYVCCLDSQPKVVLDNKEVTTLKWVTSLEMLDEHIQERVFLAPPQVYELSRVHKLSSYLDVKHFTHDRQKQGTERWLPVIATYEDGALSVLPGDDFYPAEPDMIGTKPVPDYPQTVDEMYRKSKNVNRIVLKGPTCKALCNIELNCGHLSPITYPEPSDPATQSSMVARSSL